MFSMLCRRCGQLHPIQVMCAPGAPPVSTRTIPQSVPSKRAAISSRPRLKGKEATMVIIDEMADVA
jgi:hypothetical protein